MSTAQTGGSAAGRLAEQFDGELLGPDGAGYETARTVFNGMIDKRPAVIARRASTSDVVAAVNHAREAGLVVAVRCGGHSVAGTSVCDSGMLIDLAGLKQVDVDVDARVARTGGGVLWGELDAVTQQHGLHTPGGRVTTTGVGGFTLGGGYGWTSSVHGLTCDNLISAEVVTADGRVLTASEEENPDLFWAIRGGGGNFGILTRFDFRLHPLGPIVLAGMAIWPVERAPEVLRGWRECVEQAPDELSTSTALLTAPPEPFIPEHLRGKPVVAIVGMYVGDPAAAAPVLQPIKDLGPEVDLIQPMPYTAFQAIVDQANPPGLRNYFRGDYLERLSDEAIGCYVDGAREATALSPLSQIVIFRLGGGVTSVANEATAFSHREARYLFHPILLWTDPADDERQVGTGRRLGKSMRPFGTGASYLNFTPDTDRVQAAYGADKYLRLVALKDVYDPTNLFRLNQNIPPSGR